MKRLKNIETQGQQGVDINMAPLIDMVFLLLIFFLSTTVFVEETGVKINRARAVSSETLDQHSLVMALTAEGTIYFAGRPVHINSVRGIVAQRLKEKNVPVILMADNDARSGRLVEVIDQCKLAGAMQVSIATKKE